MLPRDTFLRGLRPDTGMANARTNRMGHRAALAVVATILLGIIVLLPFAIGSALGELLRPEASHRYSIAPSGVPAAADRSHLYVHIVGIDQWQRTATLRVSGSYVCETSCTWDDRFLFVAALATGQVEAREAQGLPPSQAVTFPPTGRELTQILTLPVVGDPIRFPFDRYRLGLGVIMQRVFASGTIQAVSPEDAVGRVFITLDADVPQTSARISVAADPNDLGLTTTGYQYIAVTEAIFVRPLYLKVMTVTLVLLAAATAAYAVFLRPLDELVINSGALILSIWGIRAILVGATPPGLTAVDLSLSMIILFLLTAISARALQYHRGRAAIHLRYQRHSHAGPQSEDAVPRNLSAADRRRGQ